MKEITSYTSNFEDIIKGNYLYVDKTEYIWNLVKSYKGVYFMARPRRFGKSLTVSTLEAVFQGKRELFKGLAIYDKDYDWKPYPVIRFTFSTIWAQKPEHVEAYLNDELTMVAKDYYLSLKGKSSAERFENLINDISAYHGKIVILIDEYDQPLLTTREKPFAKDALEILKAFYSCIKAFDKNARFVFVTGYSKISHESLFYGVNNLTDITMDSGFSTILGYTQTEFESYFAEHIDHTVKKLNIPREDFMREIKIMYGGYQFSKNAETVYNPVSTAKFFYSEKPQFHNFWFEAGTPSFLVNYCKNNKFNLEEAIKEPVSDTVLRGFEFGKINPLALFLQAGYLTIKGSCEKNGDIFYRLGFPNKEVQSSYEEMLMNAYTD